jgi:hypothetical protein
MIHHGSGFKCRGFRDLRLAALASALAFSRSALLATFCSRLIALCSRSDDQLSADDKQGRADLAARGDVDGVYPLVLSRAPVDLLPDLLLLLLLPHHRVPARLLVDELTLFVSYRLVDVSYSAQPSSSMCSKARTF